MLRPATPLSVLLFVAFVLLLISVLSTPIIKQVPLASFDDVDFGVFGYCQGSSCSGIKIGYDPDISTAQNSSFDLPTGTRTSLSAILIIHPVAALFTLVMFGLAAAAHFHSPSHSPRYLLGIFILSILTLLLSLLSFLIDVLLFVPHMAWGSYVVLAATILIAASVIISCAMRRTLVSRKARKRRIAENAEMNGENYYNRQPADLLAPPVTAAMASGALGADKVQSYAEFGTGKPGEERTSDERIPLTTRTPSETSPGNLPAMPAGPNDRYGGLPGMGGNPHRDQYGNPMPVPPPGSYGSRSRDPSADPSINRNYSNPSMNSRGRGGMPPGGYRGRGPPNGRGGYGPPPRGYYGGPRGGYGPQRGGYGPPGPYRGGPPGGMNDMAAGAMMRGGRGRGAPPGYGPPRGYSREQSPGAYDTYGQRPPPQAPAYAPDGGSRMGPDQSQYAPYNPELVGDDLPRAESPPPIPGLEHDGVVGQAVEMDATTGSPSTTPKGFGQFGQLRDSDGDVAGMVGLQQQRRDIDRHDTVRTDNSASRYSSDEPYVPPRQAWADGGGPSTLNQTSHSPTELPNSHSPQSGQRTISGDHYFEDVAPRFAEPPALVPGNAAGYSSNTTPSSDSPQPRGIEGINSYEEIQEGARSPVESERSERSGFTSVSQRGVNPRWNPGPGYGPPMPNQRMNAPQRNDILLNSNPDFQLPGGNRGGRVGGSSRGRGPPPMGNSMVPGSAYPGSNAL